MTTGRDDVTRAERTQLDRRGRWLLVLAGVSGAAYGVVIALSLLDLNHALQLWWVAVLAGAVGLLLGLLVLRHQWKIEGGRAAKLELDRWIHERRLPDDVSAGASVSRLVKRADRQRGPVLTGVLACFWTLFYGTELFDPSHHNDAVALVFRASVVALFWGAFVQALVFSRGQAHAITALVEEGQRRLAEPSASGRNGA